MANETFDLVVIGTGPGGYVAAIRAAQLGMKVAVVEKRATFGGTCLNVGCIPSKALLQSSHLFEQAGHDLGVHGIVLGPPKLDFAQLMKRKSEVVEATTKGVAFLFRKNKRALAASRKRARSWCWATTVRSRTRWRPGIS
jgi:dihydrolipoamide dehydrogenase